MKRTTGKKASASDEACLRSIFAVADQVHHTVARRCAQCGQPMTPSDVNDYGCLCEACYTEEYED